MDNLNVLEKERENKLKEVLELREKVQELLSLWEEKVELIKEIEEKIILTIKETNEGHNKNN